MKSGDIFIFKSDFHKMYIGIIFLETQIDGDVFIPVLFENNYFDNTVDAIYKAKIKTNTIFTIYYFTRQIFHLIRQILHI